MAKTTWRSHKSRQWIGDNGTASGHDSISAGLPLKPQTGVARAK